MLEDKVSHLEQSLVAVVELRAKLDDIHKILVAHINSEIATLDQLYRSKHAFEDRVISQLGKILILFMTIITILVSLYAVLHGESFPNLVSSIVAIFGL